MTRLNPAHVEALVELVNQSPVFETMDMRIDELGEGYCRGTMEVARKHLNAFGGIYGGSYACLLDMAAYWALYCLLPEDMGAITLDMVVDNLRAVNSGVLTVEGGVIKQGSTICLTEAVIRDEKGRMLARCQSKQYLSPTLQPISAAVESLGVDPLPPKFIED